MEKKESFKKNKESIKPFNKGKYTNDRTKKPFKGRAFNKAGKPKYDFISYVLVFSGSRVSFNGYKNARYSFDGFESGCTLYGVKPDGSLREIAKK